jgi:hypothetical protein
VTRAAVGLLLIEPHALREIRRIRGLLRLRGAATGECDETDDRRSERNRE